MENLPKYIETLNAPQREAAIHVKGPLMVLAGAGSGKTKMLTARMAYLIDRCHVPPYRILAVTFTNKAAAEMKERVDRTIREHTAGLSGAIEIGTFHSVCVRILRREMDKTPFTKNFVIYDDSDQLTLIKSILKKLNIDPKSFDPKSFQSAINRLKCDAHEPEDVELSVFSPFQKRLKSVYEQYQKDLFTNNALDFGEIVCLTYRILRDNPEVRKKYQNLYQYIHVDEYQDTNRAQYLLLSMLASEQNGGHSNICVVGDEDQSIYKWRGADIRNILEFERDFPGAHVVKLEQNYRSTKTIIEAASFLIRNNVTRKNKVLWTDNETGKPVVRMQLPNDRFEAEAVVSEIKRQVTEQGRDYDEIAIFYRAHSQSRQLEDILRRDKVPYQIIGGLRFYDRKEVKDLLSYFKFIVNPADLVSLKRIINVPARGIGKTTIEKLEQFLDGRTDLLEGLRDALAQKSVLSSRAASQVRKFVDLIDLLTEEQTRLCLSDLYHLILDETQYVSDLRKENTVEAKSRIQNLEELGNFILEFEEEVSHKPDAERPIQEELLPVFLERTSLVTNADQKEQFSSIKMMTLHMSKGLEFPVVFMVGLEEGLFPSIKAWEGVPEEEIEEERRLCYVGMTRAREQLYMTHVSARRIWGQIQYQEPARFFEEIPEEYLQHTQYRFTPEARDYYR